MRQLILLCCLLPIGLLLAQRPVDVRTESYPTASGVTVQAEVGTLRVHEYRADPASAEIEVSYVRLKSTAANPATPLVFLDGGPGSSPEWVLIPRVLDDWLPLLDVADVILFIQRGTGAAGRRLLWIDPAPTPADVFVTEAAANDHFRSMARRATAHWDSLGIDLRGYTTVENATDLDELRQALDLPKISLLGFSYGTHLGQTYLKYFGEYVDRAILVGVEGLGQTFKLPQTLDGQFSKLAALVAADPEVRDDVPDLLALYDRVSARLTAEPIVLEVTHPVTRKSVSVRIGKLGLDMILLRDIGDASDLPVFPRLLYTIERGDYSVLQWFLQKRYRSVLGLSAMNIATDLASGADPARLELIRAQAAQSRFGNVITTPFLALSEVWPVPPLGADFRAPFTTSVPVLLLSGSLDNNTPPYQAEQLRWSLPNARHIIVQNAGHEQIMYHPNVRRAMVDFLRRDEVTAVTAVYPPLRFIPVRGSREGVSHPAVQRER